MKKIKLFLILITISAVSGCAASSKTVAKPPMAEPVGQAPAITTEQGVVNPPPVEAPAPDIAAEPSMPAIPEYMEPAPASEEALQPVRMQYSQAMNLISEFMEIKVDSTGPDEKVHSGVSENNLITMKIREDNRGVKEASMKFIYPERIDKTTAELNNAMMSRFLKNIAPETEDWNARIKQMLDRFNSMAKGSDGIAVEDIGLANNRNIHILYDKNADYVEITFKALP